MQNDVELNTICFNFLFAESKRNAVKRAKTSDVKDVYNFIYIISSHVTHDYKII